MQIFLTHSIVAADDGIHVEKKMSVEMCKFSLLIEEKLTLDIFYKKVLTNCTYCDNISKNIR